MQTRIVKILLGLFFVMCLAAIVGLVLEIVYSRSNLYPTNGQEYDAYTLWKWKKMIKATQNSEEFGPYLIETDRYGFRNIGKDYVPDTTTCRLMIIGDSYTAGLYLPYDKLYSTLLEQGLDATKYKGRKIEVFNMSCPGWGIDQEYMCLIHYGLKIKPDFVFLMCCPNDVRETSCKKYANLQEGNVVFNPLPVTGKEIRLWRLSNYSSFYQYLQRKVFYTDYGSSGWLRKKWPMNYGKEDADNWDRPLFLKQPIPEVSASMNLFNALLSAMEDTCRAHTIRLSAACVPLIEEYSGRMAGDTMLQTGLVADSISQMCARKGIDFVRLDSIFSKQANPMELFRNNGDYHWSSKGDAVVATQLIAYYRQLFTKP